MEKIQEAALSGEFDRLRELLEGSGIDLKSQVDFGEQLLEIAIKNGDDPIVAYLLKKGVNASKFVHYDPAKFRHQLFEAVLSENIVKVRLYFETDIKEKISRETLRRFLISAVIHDNKALAELLVENGADMNDHVRSGRHKGKSIRALAKSVGSTAIDALLDTVSEADQLDTAVSSTKKQKMLSNLKAHFCISLMGGNFEKVKFFVEKCGADVNWMTAQKTCRRPSHSMLHFAIISGQLEIVRYLVKQGANIKDADVITALRSEEYSIFEYLVKEFGSQIREGALSGTLRYAIEKKKKKVVNFLIERGAPIDAIPEYIIEQSNNAIQEKIAARRAQDEKSLEAVMQGDIEFLEKQFQLGIIINYKNPKTETVFMKIVEDGKVEVIDFLFRTGKIPAEIAEKGLKRAVSHGNAAVVSCFIAHGIDIDCLYEENPALSLKEQEVMRIINERVALNNRFLDAASRGDLDALDALSVVGISLNQKSKVKKDAFMEASKNGHVNIIRYLLSHAAVEEELMDDAIIIAAENNCVDIVKYLIELGFDIRKKSKSHGKYPAHTQNDRREFDEKTVIETLFIAFAANGNTEMLTFLMQMDINLSAYTITQAALAAVEKTHLAVLTFLEDQYHANDVFMIAAAEQGSLEILDFLMNKFSDKLSYIHHDRILTAAVKHNHMNVVEYFHKKGKLQYAGDLLCAAIEAKNQEMVQYLVDRGMNIDACDVTKACNDSVIKEIFKEIFDRRRLLNEKFLEAIENGDLALLQTCFEKGDFIPSLSSYAAEAAPMSRASAMGHVHIMAFLREKGFRITGYSDGESIRNKPLELAAKSDQADAVIYLLKNGAEINALFRGRETYSQAIKNIIDEYTKPCNQLIEAAKTGDLSLLSVLLEMGVDPTSTDVEGRCALYEAVICGQLAAVKMLCEKYAFLEEDPYDKRLNLLRLAVQYRHIAVAEYLLGLKIPHDRLNCIETAIENDHFEMFQLLYKYGVKYNVYDNKEYFKALIKKDRVEYVKCLLDTASEENVNRLMKDAFIAAASTGCIAVLQDLLKRKMDIEQVVYPLYDGYDAESCDTHESHCEKISVKACKEAVKAGHIAVLQFLLQYVDIENAGEVILKEAINARQIQIIEFLISIGIPLKVGEMDEVLSRAVSHNERDMVYFLIGAGVDIKSIRSKIIHYPFPDKKDEKYERDKLEIKAVIEERRSLNNRFVSAAMEGNLTELDALLAQGACVNHQNSDGQIAFIQAIKNGHFHVVKFLMQRGVDLNKKNKIIRGNPLTSNVGRAALEAAVEVCSLEIVQYLLDAGVQLNSCDGSILSRAINIPQSVFNQSNKQEKMAQQLQIVKCLVNYGIAIEHSHLKEAISKNIFEIVEYLIGKGVCLWQGERSGTRKRAEIEYPSAAIRDLMTSRIQLTDTFIRAAGSGELAVVKRCLADGVFISHRNAENQSAFIQAVSKGHLHVVKFLIQKGIKFEKSDTEYYPENLNEAMKIAQKNNHTDVLNFLLKYKSYVKHLSDLSDPSSFEIEEDSVPVKEYELFKGEGEKEGKIIEEEEEQADAASSLLLLSRKSGNVVEGLPQELIPYIIQFTDNIFPLKAETVAKSALTIPGGSFTASPGLLFSHRVMISKKLDCMAKRAINIVENHAACYTTNEIAFFVQKQMVSHMFYTGMDKDSTMVRLTEKLKNFKKYQELEFILSIKTNETHFSALYIRRNPGRRFSCDVFYIDPTGNSGSLAEPIKRILQKELRVSSNQIIASKTMLQCCDAKEKITLMDDLHSGAYLIFILTEMMRGYARIHQTMLEINIGDEDHPNWHRISHLNQESSKEFGEMIRQYHAEFLRTRKASIDLKTYLIELLNRQQDTAEKVIDERERSELLSARDLFPGHLIGKR
ncbi:MAG TPA: ankyrin repeat domain-containing protein [Gammaproteobacteria bacterium]|jgi:ankyrin repeat protein|nr:ankyrin repeat domain-containing protein [Gammaproteobacteria bacterium]